MNKFNFVVFGFIVLIHFPGIAQSGDKPNSKETAKKHGLVFETESKDRSGKSSYTEVIQLFNLGKKAQAMQFRLLINKAPDDSTILIFEEIQKGTDLEDPSWLLDFNVKKGPILKNGASSDEIYVVLYNMNQNGGLFPGDYQNLFTVKYRLPELSDLKKDIKSSIKISYTEASTFDGFAIDIKPARDEFKIYVRKK